MTDDQPRQLKARDRVCWNADDQGMVTEKNWTGATIKWDNRSEQAILHDEMAQVERVPTTVTGMSLACDCGRINKSCHHRRYC